MDIIREEASILIQHVLKESVTVLSNRQQKQADHIGENYTSSPIDEESVLKHAEFTDTDFSKRQPRQSVSDISNDGKITSKNNCQSIINQEEIFSTVITVPAPICTSDKERRVEKQFQKISSEVENIDISAESFDQAYDSFIHDDEISSLHQDFSKISWNESISATTSTIADIEQNTPDTDAQDFFTDTGGENIQRDMNEEMLLETNTIELDITRPSMLRTSLTISEENDKDTISNNNKECMKYEMSEPNFHEPQRQQQKSPNELFKKELLDQSFSNDVQDINFVELDTLNNKQISSCNINATPKKENIENAFPNNILSEQTILRKKMSENHMCSSLSDINEKLKHVDSFADTKSGKSEKADNISEPQTSFYIGESSRNIIIKSKFSHSDDEEESIENSIDEKEKCKTQIFTEQIQQFEPTSEPTYILIEKVVRQGSETRNDILEIESDIEKQNLEEQKVTEPIGFLNPDELNDSSIHSSIVNRRKEVSAKQLIDVEGQGQTSKLDLSFEKSELELSEKLCSFQSKNKLSDIIEIYKADTSLPDKHLVERTLEEVELSLDAAKEELIQVVRDGKTIKQSPSEFEFKNIGQTKCNLDERDGKSEGLLPPTVLDNIQDINDLIDPMNKINSGSQLVEKSIEITDEPIDKPTSPVSSSSESYYKSVSRPCSSEFDAVQTFHTSSEYQTAIDASTFRGSTEYISAAGTLEISGQTISSRESMKSLSSEASGILGSIDASDLSETLIASIADQDIDIEMEMDNDDLDVIEQENIIQNQPIESQQMCMKRSQEMIFTKEEITSEIPIKIQSKQTEGCVNLKDEQILASSLEENSILSISSSSAINTVISNFEELIGSAGSSSLAGLEMLTSVSAEGSVFQILEPNDNTIQCSQSEIIYSDKSLNGEEARRRGHKRNESTLVPNELVKNLLEEGIGNTTLDNTSNETAILSNITGDDHKGSESESDHDPYESEYSRAFKSPNLRKKKNKENKPTDALEHWSENFPEVMHLAGETIIEDAVTEELESQIIAEEERRPSQNMQNYSKIPDITVTEEISKCGEESDLNDYALYKVKAQDQLNEVEDTPIPKTAESAVSLTDETFNVLVQQQYMQKLAELNEAKDFDSGGPDSPDSFEMVDQPDIADEFVIIEEVAKEVSEFDVEGKSIKISSNKLVKKHDEEVEQILIKSAPAATNLGSQIFRDDLNFEFEESPPSAQTEEDSEIEANKKWVDHASQLRYPYELERGVLEDIKEEDTEFEVGSSRISSIKDSFSSTPDYDTLAGRKYFSKTENDNISMSSLQEFENLEQAISLENRRICQGSTDSSNGSFTRRYTTKTSCGDDVSLSSLREFEGLENACIEAHLIEIKAKEEAALLLSRSDDSNNSNNDKENTQSIVVSKVKYISMQLSPKQSVEAILKAKLEECENSKSNLMETSVDSLEIEPDASRDKFGYEVSEHGSVDSLEINKSVELVTSSIDSFDISKEMSAKSDADSLEPLYNREKSIDSNEMEQLVPLSGHGSDAENKEQNSSIEPNRHNKGTENTTSISVQQNMSNISTNISNDSLNLFVEQTSSAAKH